MSHPVTSSLSPARSPSLETVGDSARPIQEQGDKSASLCLHKCPNTGIHKSCPIVNHKDNAAKRTYTDIPQNNLQKSRKQKYCYPHKYTNMWQWAHQHRSKILHSQMYPSQFNAYRGSQVHTCSTYTFRFVKDHFTSVLAHTYTQIVPQMHTRANNPTFTRRQVSIHTHTQTNKTKSSQTNAHKY